MALTCLGNLQLIKKLQSQVEELKANAVQNKKSLLEYIDENVKLSEPLAKVSAEIVEVQTLLKERTKDQMALRNSHARLISMNKSTQTLRVQVKALEEDYAKMEQERDHIYHTYEDTLHRIQQQSDFHNQVLSQKLYTAEANSTKLVSQCNELILASNLDLGEMSTILSNLYNTVIAKDQATKTIKFHVVKEKKSFNDLLQAVQQRFSELGISEDEINSLGFDLETLPAESTDGPAGLVASV